MTRESYLYRTSYCFRFRTVIVLVERKKRSENATSIKILCIGLSFSLSLFICLSAMRTLHLSVSVSVLFSLCNGSFKKKVYRDLDHVEKCGFSHGVQHVSNNKFKAFLDIENFWPFLLYFMGIFGKQKFEVDQNGIKLILPDRTGIWDVKNHTFSHCLCTMFE